VPGGGFRGKHLYEPPKRRVGCRSVSCFCNNLPAIHFYSAIDTVSDVAAQSAIVPAA
jgi:hypothetical protein